jgi:hypothetical protein
MERAQARLMALFAVILLSLTAILTWWEPAEEGQKGALIWVAPETETVRTVRIERPDDVLTLTGSGQTWVLGEHEHPADWVRVQELLGDLATLTRAEALPDADGQGAGLGDPPQARVIVTLADGTTRQVDVGDEAVGYRTYVRLQDGSVGVAPGVIRRILADPADRFRDHRLFQFDPAAVRKVRIEGPEGTLEVEGEKTDWWLAGHSRADADRVDDLIMGLLETRMVRYDDSLPAPGEDVVFLVTVWLEDGTSHSMRVGENTPMGIVTQSALGELGVAQAESLVLLTQGPTDVGVETAFGLHLELSDRVVLTSADGSVWTGTRNGGAWEGEGADPWSVAQGVATAPMVYARQPPSAPTDTWLRVEVHSPSGVRTTRVGAHIEPGFRTAIDQDGGAPFRINVESLSFVDTLFGPGPSPVR